MSQAARIPTRSRFSKNSLNSKNILTIYRFWWGEGRFDKGLI